MLLNLSELSGFHSDSVVFLGKENNKDLVINYIWWQQQEADPVRHPSSARPLLEKHVSNCEPQLLAESALDSGAAAALVENNIGCYLRIFSTDVIIGP